MGDDNLRNDWGDMGRVRGLLLAARDICNVQVKANQIKVKSKGPVFGNWQEAGTDLLEYLGTSLPDATICLQLSHVHPWEGAGGDIAAPSMARRLHEMFVKGSNIEDLLNECTGKHLVMWIPGEHDAMSRMLGNIQKLAVRCNGRSVKLTLLLPFSAHLAFRTLMMLWICSGTLC